MNLYWPFFLYTTSERYTDKATLYNRSFYRLSKLGTKSIRDLTKDENDRCKKDTKTFDEDNCVSNALDYLLKFKGEEPKAKNKIFEHNLQYHVHNGSGFATWIKLNNLACDREVTDFNKNGKGITSLKVSNRYILNNKKQNPQYLIFRSGMAS